MSQAPTPQDWETARDAIRRYAQARLAFRHEQEKSPILLCGNDNKVGIAGEFWAKEHYWRKGYRNIEVQNASNEGFDFKCSKDGRTIRVSVKVVSKESKTGRQLPLRESQRWDELVLVLLDDDLAPYRIGIVTREQFEQAKAAGAVGQEPYVSRSWLGDKGWMTKYGTTTEREIT